MSDVAEVKEAIEVDDEMREKGFATADPRLVDAARRWVRVVSEGRYCPFCGRLRERENLDDEMCLPSNCDAWKFVRRFNHETREWEPVVAAVGVEKETL